MLSQLRKGVRSQESKKMPYGITKIRTWVSSVADKVQSTTTTKRADHCFKVVSELLQTEALTL